MELNKIYQGDALSTLKTFPDESINCVMTSPPYWALRDYGIKGQLGLEPTFKEHISNMCDIFDEVKRVLRKDGTCWVNYGDTYSGTPASGMQSGISNKSRSIKRQPKNTSLPDKSLVMIPFRFAIEMVNRGWILRNVIIWHKPNPMPSSAKDRFTVDFEYLFFFSKSKKYWFEQQFEKARYGFSEGGFRGGESGAYTGNKAFDNSVKAKHGTMKPGKGGGRNQRCVWKIPLKELSSADLGYIAGLFDGEGSVVIRKVSGKHTFLATTITSTNKDILDWVIYKTGIGKLQHRRFDYKKDTYEWVATSHKAAEFLLGIYPFLQIRREQAKTALEFQIYVLPPGQKLEDYARKRREELLKEAQALNKGNVLKSTSPEPSSVWRIPTQPFKAAHFAVFPEKLCITPIKAGCPPKGIVLDPFMGAGTTAVVARKLGRDYVGIELNPEYIKIAERRLQQQVLL